VINPPPVILGEAENLSLQGGILRFAQGFSSGWHFRVTAENSN